MSPSLRAPLYQRQNLAWTLDIIRHSWWGRWQGISTQFMEGWCNHITSPLFFRAPWSLLPHLKDLYRVDHGDLASILVFLREDHLALTFGQKKSHHCIPGTVAFTIQLQQAPLLPALPAWVMSRQVAAGTNLGKGMPTGHWPAPGSQVKSRTDLLEALGFLPGGLCVHICVNWPKRHPGQRFPRLTPPS